MKKAIFLLAIPFTFLVLTYAWGYITWFWNFYHTVSLYLFLFCLSLYIFSISKKKGGKIISMNFLIILLTLFGLEIYLRFVNDHRLATHQERNGRNFYTEATGVHYSMKNLKEGNVLYLNPPGNRVFKFSQVEFSHDYAVDSLGLYTACSVQKDTSSLRILTLGDSFTFGLGAPADSSWPCLLQKIINSKYSDSDITIINGGNLGADPVYLFKSLKEVYFKAFKPDVVTLSVNHSDIEEIMIRGGEERYHTHAAAIKNPFFTPLFGASYVFRLVMVKLFKYDVHLVLDTRKIPELEKKARATIISTIREMNRWCDIRGTDLVVIYHPIPYDAIFNKMECIQPVMDELKHEIKQVNMLDEFYKCGFEPYEHVIYQYYWPIDRHHNSNGYYLFGHIMAEQLHSFGYIKKDLQ